MAGPADVRGVGVTDGGVVDGEETLDGRRVAGSLTRGRLIAAAQELVAERGEDAVRLRDVSTAARANVASVRYHFGSLGALLKEAEAEAIDRVVDAQLAELEGLGRQATLHEIAGAFFRPMVDAVTASGSARRQYVRVLTRLAADPPAELQDRVAESVERAHAALQSRLRGVLPDVPEDELAFRVRCVGSIFALLSGWAMEPDIRNRTAEQVEDRLLPVVAGALAGG